MPNLETFINETMLSDLSICDGLIEYHKNNVEYKRRNLTAAGEDTNKNMPTININFLVTKSLV